MMFALSPTLMASPVLSQPAQYGPLFLITPVTVLAPPTNVRGT